VRDTLDTGATVRLVGQRLGETFVVESSEVHNNLTFYRLRELVGALFLRSSLVLV
jgi:hypothetical protein